MSRMPRPALTYQGGKYRIAPWIIGFFPPHKIYLEPFGGAANILLNKPRSVGEVYNDLDGNIVNVFRVLQNREKAEELKYRLRHTPWSREEWLMTFREREGNDEIETARRTIIRSFLTNGADGATRNGLAGFALRLCENGLSHDVKAWTTYPCILKLFTERLQGVIIENKDALKLIPQLDRPDTLHYVDPPYMPGTWYEGSYRQLPDFEYHKALLERLKSCEGMVVLSGYDNEYYRAELSDWEMYTKETYNQKNEKRIECLWLNPHCMERRRNKQLKLL